MKVHRDITSLPHFRNAVVTIGTFDGVHLGHCQIIRQLKEEAHRIGGVSVLVTFHPHPRRIIGERPDRLYLLNTTEEKIQLLEEAGIDHLVVIPFTESFARQTAREYIENFLTEKFRPHTLIIGYDHHFGNNRAGDFHLLEEYAARSFFKLIEIPGHLLHEAAISSTRIREALLHGNIEEANELLGYRYFFSGTVVEGNKLGRTIGYPTANVAVPDAEKLIPANGVYAVDVEVAASSYAGMMNIGVRPTVGGTHRVIEVNIFSFEAMIYGEKITVRVKRRLRDEIKFSGIEALVEQLAIDKNNAMDD